MKKEERALIKSLHSRLLGMIFGVILVVNATAIGEAGPPGLTNLLTTNINLLGWIIIMLCILRVTIDYWLGLTTDQIDSEPDDWDKQVPKGQAEKK